MNPKKNALLLAVAVSLTIWTSRAGDITEVWNKNCAPCHGKDGKGQTKAGKKAGVVNLTDSKIQDKFSDEEMFKAVKEGKKDGNITKMKPAERLTDPEIKALIVHVRTLKK